MRRPFWFLLSLALLANPAAAAPKKTPTPAKHGVKKHDGYKASAKKQTAGKKPATLQERVLGKWTQVGGQDTVEFSKDGMMVAENPNMRLQGKYTLHEDGRMEVDLGLGNLTHGPLIRKVTLQGDDLTIADDRGGPVMKYKRAK